MTYQTCCGGISSDDPNIKEGGGVPYMTRNCFSVNNSEWSKPECQQHCCDKDDDGNIGSCIPTQDGGYCKFQDKYWRYDEDKSQYEIPATDTRSLEPYPSSFADVQHVEDLTVDKYYKRRMYDNTRAKVIRDMFNESMNDRIMKTPNWKAEDRNDGSYDNPQDRHVPTSMFQDVSWTQLISFPLLSLLLFVYIVILTSRIF